MSVRYRPSHCNGSLRVEADLAGVGPSVLSILLMSWADVTSLLLVASRWRQTCTRLVRMGGKSFCVAGERGFTQSAQASPTQASERNRSLVWSARSR
jgi:hypothetical protein